jgi:hypothetical protein
MIAAMIDKGELVRKALRKDIPVFGGESFTLISTNDLSRLRAHVARLESVIDKLVQEE